MAQPNFKPLKLNETNINNIFSSCLASSKSKKITSIILFSKNSGFSENSKELSFDTEQLERFDLDISYLFGQLKQVHQNASSITPKDVPYIYSGGIWSKNSGIFMKFLHLGVASDNISPFNAKEGYALLLTDKPTLSPDDPNFPAWWEEHKAEWEQPQGKVLRKRGGQEPGDN